MEPSLSIAALHRMWVSSCQGQGKHVCRSDPGHRVIVMARQQGRFQLASDIIPMPLWMGPRASSMALQPQRVAAHLQGRKSTVSGKAREELHLHMTALLRGCGPARRKQSKHLGSQVLLASGIEDIRFCAECKHWVEKNTNPDCNTAMTWGPHM